jgi:hypothetical protein
MQLTWPAEQRDTRRRTELPAAGVVKLLRLRASRFPVLLQGMMQRQRQWCVCSRALRSARLLRAPPG